jgi:hypothetical protein
MDYDPYMDHKGGHVKVLYVSHAGCCGGFEESRDVDVISDYHPGLLSCKSQKKPGFACM